MHSLSKHQWCPALREAWGDIIVPASRSLQWRGGSSKAAIVRATKEKPECCGRPGLGVLGVSTGLGAEGREGEKVRAVRTGSHGASKHRWLWTLATCHSQASSSPQLCSHQS